MITLEWDSPLNASEMGETPVTASKKTAEHSGEAKRHLRHHEQDCHQYGNGDSNLHRGHFLYAASLIRKHTPFSFGTIIL